MTDSTSSGLITAASLLKALMGVVVSVGVVILSLFLNDLSKRFDTLDLGLRSKVDMHVFELEKARVSELKTAVEARLPIEFYRADYARFCADIADIKKNQAEIQSSVNDVVKLQQRVIQKLDIR